MHAQTTDRQQPQCTHMLGLPGGVHCAELQRHPEPHGSQARCLRNIMRILSFFISRISNSEVRRRAGKEALSQRVRRSQLQLLGEVLQREDRRVLRDVAFHRGTFTPETAAYVRRLGRPRQNWTDQLLNMVQQQMDPSMDWGAVASSPSVWKEICSRIV